mgnify:CR=1 FL=1
MKHISLFLIIVFSIFSTQKAFSQSSCIKKKSFNKGETVYMWTKKEWESKQNSWVEYTFDGKNGSKYNLVRYIGNMKSTMKLNGLENVYSQYEYNKLGGKNPVCSTCTASHIANFNKESLGLINNYRAKYNITRLHQNPVCR